MTVRPLSFFFLMGLFGAPDWQARGRRQRRPAGAGRMARHGDPARRAISVRRGSSRRTKEPRPIQRLTDVSRPTVTVHKPAAARDTGTAVVICPGGGYSVLAMDLEGDEVADWLNSIGVTGIVLKYRVPIRKGQPKYLAPLQDAQRAVSLVRSHAAEWKIAADRIGILGFSAGGHLSAAAATNWDHRQYPALDDVDKVSCRRTSPCCATRPT